MAQQHPSLILLLLSFLPHSPVSLSRTSSLSLAATLFPDQHSTTPSAENSPSKPRPFPLPLASAQLGETKKITSGESDGFRGHFRPNHCELVGVQVSGDLRGFRGSFRPNHGELGVVQGGDRHDALMCGARELLDELQVQESQRCGDYEEFSGVLTDWTKLGLTFGYIKL
ncbi:uncharacterized protein LOC126607741 [Malus sylvestris]|uniref:uncharacterized protein LOC126607741 n=1 Tax=Malus sylvestris TaxID=3752 RepID=UPI0021AC32CD|nr:uncharacterized protein LOC126607741 [Malus sylvestris]